MKVQLAGRQGDQVFSCRWHDETGRDWVARTRVTVYPPRQFEQSLIRLGDVQSGQAIQKQFTFEEYAKSADGFHSAPELTVRAESWQKVRLQQESPRVERLSDHLVRRVTTARVDFDISDRTGYGTVVVTPKYTADVEGLRPSMVIDWSVPQIVDLSPSRIAIVGVREHIGLQTRVVRVVGLGGRALKVSSVTTTDDSVAARVHPVNDANADAAEVTVTVTLPERRLSLSAEVVLRLSEPSLQEVRIPVSILVLAPSGPSGP